MYDLNIVLTAKEKALYNEMVTNDERPYGFEYKENEYSKYCEDCKRIITKYVERYDLSHNSINRIFKKYFMYDE